MNSKDAFKKHILRIEESQGLKLSDLIYYLSNQSFNTKGQDLEKLLYILLKNSLNEDSIKIQLSENKSSTDLEIINPADPSINGLSLKNYTPNRIQISTFKNHLSETIQLSQKDPNFSEESVVKIKEYIKETLKNELTLITLFDSSKSVASSFFFDYEKFLEQIETPHLFIAAAGGKTEHSRLVLLKKENYRMTLDLGTNPLNRGIWAEKIDIQNPPSFFETIFRKEINKDQYNQIDQEDILKIQLDFLSNLWKK